MIIPNTNRHPNNTKTDHLPILEVITGLPRPYHNSRRQTVREICVTCHLFTLSHFLFRRHFFPMKTRCTARRATSTAASQPGGRGPGRGARRGSRLYLVYAQRYCARWGPVACSASRNLAPPLDHTKHGLRVLSFRTGAFLQNQGLLCFFSFSFFKLKKKIDTNHHKSGIIPHGTTLARDSARATRSFDW